MSYIPKPPIKTPVARHPEPALIKSSYIVDHRGGFLPIAIGKEWIQINVSTSKKGVFRGLHHQSGKFMQSKMVTVLQGSIIDMLVDLRAGQIGEFHKFEITAGESLFVPKGFAHSFLSLQDDTIVQYLVDAPYSKENEVIINWRSIMGVKTTIDWVTKLPIISSKDDEAPYFEEAIHGERDYSKYSESFANVPKINTN